MNRYTVATKTIIVRTLGQIPKTTIRKTSTSSIGTTATTATTATTRTTTTTATENSGSNSNGNKSTTITCARHRRKYPTVNAPPSPLSPPPPPPPQPPRTPPSRTPPNRSLTTAANATMQDEYSTLPTSGKTYIHPGPFPLESSTTSTPPPPYSTLPNPELRYTTYGTLNPSRDNTIVVCHALTGNHNLHAWWPEMLGPGKVFDTDRYHIVSCTGLGCHPGTSPLSPLPTSSTSSPSHPPKPYGTLFPAVSIRDSVSLQLHLLRHHLRLPSILSVVGGSFGGMQTVEYAALAGSGGDPYVRSVVPIACGAVHTAWQIGIGEIQRQAVYNDERWRGGDVDMDDPPLGGLGLARMMGMVTYRTARGYRDKFGRRVMSDKEKKNGAAGGGDNGDNGLEYGPETQFEVSSYLQYQNTKFQTRFDPVTYVRLTEQMDSHDVGRGRGGPAKALSGVRIPAMVIGIDSDVLYPLEEQRELADLFPRGRLEVVRSDAGHDGFLLEQERVGELIRGFLEEVE